MKKLLQVGEQLDINAAYDGGAVDSSVQYSVPVSMQDVITINSVGVVSAVSEGTAVVEIKDTSGNLLRSVVFDVLSAADFAVQADLDMGLTDLSVEIVEVAQMPVQLGFMPSTGWTIDYDWQGVLFPQSGGFKVVRVQNPGSYVLYTSASDTSVQPFDGNPATYSVLNTVEDRFYIEIPVAKKLARVEVDFLDASQNSNSSITIYQNWNYTIQITSSSNEKQVGTSVIQVNSQVNYNQFIIGFNSQTPLRRVSAIRLYE